jgi:hypothetical protein
VSEIFPSPFLFKITEIYAFCFIPLLIATRFARILVVPTTVLLSNAFTLYFSLPSDKCDVCFEL